jgi:hypothetical protein
LKHFSAFSMVIGCFNLGVLLCSVV